MTSDLLAFARSLADESRALLRRRYRSGVRVDLKADASPVTDADREVETALAARIRARHPDHGILGEEHGAHAAGAEHVWVLDPIDGTRSFATGRPLFGTLIALVRRGRPILGVIDSPITGERWSAADGLGVELDGAPIRVRERRPLREAALYASAPHRFEALATGFERLRRAARFTLYEGDCYAYGQLARGDIDLVIETDLAPYDVCALVPIVREAGGFVARWNGDEVGLDGDRTLVAASHPELALEALEILQGR